MAGTVTQTHTKRGPVGVVTFSITADASDGSAPDTAMAVKLSGRLLALETNPGATGPTANYDLVLDDADGHDVMEGVGANRDTASTEKASIVFSGTAIHPPVAVSDTLTLKLTNNSVNSATISVKIYYVGQGEG